MTGGGSWKRRGFAIAAIALALGLIAPEIPAPAGAATPRTTLVAKRRIRHHKHDVKHHKKPSLVARRAMAAAAIKAKAKAAATAKVLAAIAELAADPNWKPPATLKTKHRVTATAPATRRPASARRVKAKAIAARRRAQRAATLARHEASARAATRTRTAPKSATPKATPGGTHTLAPLSLAGFGLIALLPFVLLGLVLVGSDYLRRRAPKRAPTS
jgi:hypothetical protein